MSGHDDQLLRIWCYGFYTHDLLSHSIIIIQLLDVLMSLPVSHAILPCAVCFATSHWANHSICSYIDSSGYASGPIRRCLFIDYIINPIFASHDNIDFGQFFLLQIIGYPKLISA